MIKYIKRAGICFFAIAIICLMVVGCLCAINAPKSGSLLDLDSEKSNVDLTADETFRAEWFLSGSPTNMANLWQQVIRECLEEGVTEISVELQNNWIAPSHTELKTCFGTGVGFTDSGAIHIPQNVSIKLNLAGFTISRGLTKGMEIPDGNVITVEGELKIYDIGDNSFDHSVVQDIFDTYKHESNIALDKLKNLRYGKITGGASSTIGGGVVVRPNAKFEMYGGGVTGNYLSRTANALSYGGGGISCLQGEVYISDGIISDNIADNANGMTTHGGGIQICMGTIVISNGFIYNNSASGNGAFGGGIHVVGQRSGTNIVKAYADILGGIFYCNSAGFGGGISFVEYAVACVENVEVLYNHAQSHSAGVLVHGGTSNMIMYDSIVSYNTASGEGGDRGGAGILCNSSMELYNVQVTDNRYVHPRIDLSAYGAGVLLRLNSTTIMQDVLITRNSIVADKIAGPAYGGGLGLESIGTKVTFNSNVQIYDNMAHNVPSDVRLNKGQKIEIADNLTSSSGTTRVGIKLADDYGTDVFTTGFSESGNSNPTSYFFSNNGLDFNSDGEIVPNGKAEVATMFNGEVMFEKTISSSEYDLIYLEDNKRKSYKENGLIHAVNDYEKRQVVNDNKLILGNILPNTSISEFISKIEFNGYELKLVDNNGDIVYSNSVSSDVLDDSIEFPVGTGWRLQTYNANNEMIEEIYLSVLGDLTGDGKVNSADVTYLRKMVSDKGLHDSLENKPYVQLATLIINKNGLSINDAEILWNVVCGNIKIDLFI